MTNKRILILISLLLFSFLLVGCNWLTPNQPPVITTDALPDATVGTAYIATVEATDVDGDALTFSLVSELTDMVMSEAGVISGWTPTEVGTEDVTVIVTDGEVSVSADFTIEVTILKPPVHNITQNEYYATITLAIEDALAGDTIEVAAGTYEEDIVTIDVDGITLKSVEKYGAEIRGQVWIEADAVTVEDFYINTSTDLDVAPIDIVNAEGVTIIGNKVEGGFSAAKGINCCTGSIGVCGLVLIEDNEIIEGCIGIMTYGKPASITIRDNTMTSPGHEGIWFSNSSGMVLTIENNTVIDAGLNDVKFDSEYPASVNGVYDETKMAKAIFDANPGINSVFYLPDGLTWFQ